MDSKSKDKRVYNNSKFFNADREFEKNLHEIYPPKLKFKKENTSYFEVLFLDLDIQILDKKSTFCLYDKRNSFPFSIVQMPFLSSIVLFKTVHASLRAKIP